MKKLALVLISFSSIWLASCTANKADGTNNVKSDTSMIHNDSISSSAAKPPADTVMADSTSSAPKLLGH